MTWQVVGNIKGRDGINGKDACPIDVDGLIANVAGRIPEPKNGRDGADGKSVSVEELRALVAEEVKKVFSQIAQPKDGADGRDALQLETLPAIDPAKTYPRNTYARHAGGTVRAFRDTDALTDPIEKSGWEPVLEGIASESEALSEDGRTITRSTIYTSGRVWTREHKTASMLDRGVWKQDTVYERGDVVTWGGSGFIAQSETTTKPETTAAKSDWRLLSKRGNHGASAYDIALRNGFKGTEKQWIDSLRGPIGPEGKAGRDRY